MKILMLGRYNAADNISGPETVAKNIYKELCRQKIEISFVEYFFNGGSYSIIKKIFGNVKVNDGELVILRKGLLPLLFYLFSFKPEIVHIITFERFVILAFIFKMFVKYKIVYNVHGIVIYENTELQTELKRSQKWKDKIVEKTIYKYSDYLIFLSKRSMELAGKYYNVILKEKTVIPNGYNPVFFNINKYLLKQDRILSIVFVGDSSRTEKGLNFLLRSLNNMSDPIKLFIIGDKVDKIITNKRIEIEFKKRMNNESFINFLSDKDIFISAGFYEQFSISALEAMAVGLVVILTEETGLAEIISDGEDGFIFKYGDSKRLIEIIKDINRNRKIIDKVKENAKKKTEYYTWENIVNQNYLTLYKNICGENENTHTNR